MIKINLLNSVTERQGGTVVAVDKRSAARNTLLLMSLAVAFLFVASGAGRHQHTDGQSRRRTQLAEQKQIAADLKS